MPLTEEQWYQQVRNYYLNLDQLSIDLEENLKQSFIEMAGNERWNAINIFHSHVIMLNDGLDDQYDEFYSNRPQSWNQIQVSNAFLMMDYEYHHPKMFELIKIESHFRAMNKQIQTELCSDVFMLAQAITTSPQLSNELGINFPENHEVDQAATSLLNAWINQYYPNLSDQFNFNNEESSNIIQLTQALKGFTLHDSNAVTH
ncbi:hypothetical protein L3V82_10460 [Thiotrichales bacterium 19S3-7]|nr:hypothetical protein [Thiotrichales bacterium 19S3-7]MCF6802579.1 hypothetical protein [Thiotrichales bacterium 19S3-11]